MNRRELLTLSAGAAFSWVGMSVCRAAEEGSANKETKPSGKGGLPATEGGKLAGRTLEQLRQQYRHDLFDDFLPFMEQFVIDHERGGFMCNTDRDGTNLNTRKNSWYVGRGIWVYSFLYNELAREEKYLEVARKATEFILRDPPKGDDLWPAEYDKEGNAVAATGQYIGGKYVPVAKQVYGDLFIANGLAEYARASGDDRYWERAKKILLKCVALYDRPDYDPTAPQVYLAGDPGSEMPGVRLLGVWMLLVRLGSQMLAHREDSEIDAVVRRSIGAIFEHHYNPAYDLINEVLNHDMSRPDNEYRDLVYPGHGIETLWMVIYEAHRRKDRGLFDKAARLLRRHMEVAWDDVYGGLFRGCKNIEQNTWILDKALWVHEEALIGTLFVIEHTGADWAKEWFSRIFAYVHETFPLKKHGYALWDLWPDRKGTFVEHYERVGNFHHPRHLMLNLLSIQRMIERAGRVSGFFPN
ncbi:MAG: AGE family epimerase/isomerase [Planctomycetota bacterium]